MIAQALGHQACRQGLSAAFTTTSRLLADLAGGPADPGLRHPPAALGPSRRAHPRRRRHARGHPTQADDLDELVTERAGRSLVITANRAAADWYGLFGNPVVAESILDRLVNTAHHLHTDGRSYRPNHRPGHVREGADQ